MIFTLSVNAQYIPPDRYGDEHKGADVLRQNMGQVFDTDGNQRSDIKGYFERTPVNVYLRDSSRVSFAFTSLHKDSLAKDTTYRVDLSFVGAKSVAPTFVVPTPGITNYYRGSTATEQVPAYRRGIYQGLKQGIDLHIYGSSSGPRLSFVLQAGANPDNLVLKFTGQDSLDIDWLGSLRAYVKGRWVELREATAYQVTALGAMVDVTWTPQWIHQDGSIYAKFNFGNYDNTLPLVFQVGYAGLGGGSTPEPRNMEWSTFIGGFGSDELTDVKLDDQSNPYACGQVWSPDFPVVTGDAVFDPFLGQAAGYLNGVVMKFNHTNKQLVWGSYYGGAISFIAGHTGKTEARKLAVPNASDNNYLFAVGTTNCSDFPVLHKPGTPFANAANVSFTSGWQRMWTGAFKKTNGICDWATTHGLADNDFGEHGLAIAYDSNGGLAVGGRIYNYSNAQLQPQFPVVTPLNAFQQVTGGGFVLLFNPDFTIRWSTAFGGYDQGFGETDQRTQVTDLCFARNQSSTKLWLTGASTGAAMQYMPWPPPIGTSMYIQNEGMAFVASFDVPSLQLDYATAWGRDGRSVGYGIDYAGKDIWVVGVSESHALTSVDCPGPPSVPDIHRVITNASPALEPLNAGDGFILALDPETYELNYGTLFGGTKYDCFTDICHDGNEVYITGETRSPSSSGIDSPTSFGADLDPDRYYQPLNPNIYSRDALILAMDHDSDAPIMRWNTALGGSQSERAWSIAASPAGVYLVGTTASQTWDDVPFPLRDFTPGSEVDFYQWYNLMGAHGADWQNQPFLPFYAFEYSLNYFHTYYNEWFAETESQEYDGFIAYFSSTYHVGIQETQPKQNGLHVFPMPAPGLWNVHLPYGGEWEIKAFSTSGQQVGTWKSNESSLRIDLVDKAPGLYIVCAKDAKGRLYTAKVVRP
ncbi:MAG: hypothetical protein WAT41_01235 [Flavobacteriales bacterium]